MAKELINAKQKHLVNIEKTYMCCAKALPYLPTNIGSQLTGTKQSTLREAFVTQDNYFGGLQAENRGAEKYASRCCPNITLD